MCARATQDAHVSTQCEPGPSESMLSHNFEQLTVPSPTNQGNTTRHSRGDTSNVLNFVPNSGSTLVCLRKVFLTLAQLWFCCRTIFQNRFNSETTLDQLWCNPEKQLLFNSGTTLDQLWCNPEKQLLFNSGTTLDQLWFNSEKQLFV